MKYVHKICALINYLRRTQHLLKKILPDSKEYVILVRKSPIQNILYRAFVLATRAEIEAQNVAFNPLKARTICVKVSFIICSGGFKHSNFCSSLRDAVKFYNVVLKIYDL